MMYSLIYITKSAIYRIDISLLVDYPSARQDKGQEPMESVKNLFDKKFRLLLQHHKY